MCTLFRDDGVRQKRMIHTFWIFLQTYLGVQRGEGSKNRFLAWALFNWPLNNLFRHHYISGWWRAAKILISLLFNFIKKKTLFFVLVTLVLFFLHNLISTTYLCFCTSTYLSSQSYIKFDLLCLEELFYNAYAKSNKKKCISLYFPDNFHIQPVLYSRFNCAPSKLCTISHWLG